MLAIVAALSLSGAATAADETADRAVIHALLVDYGRTLDARDFDAFGRLFARDGVYASGPKPTVGGPAAAAMLRSIFAANALGFREPNFHLFFNEVVTFAGPDHAHATSMSLYMVPDAADRPQAALMASYDDDLVREDGRWKFARRTVKGLIPASPR